MRSEVLGKALIMVMSLLETSICLGLWFFTGLLIVRTFSAPCFLVLSFCISNVVGFSARFRNLVLKNIIRLNVHDLFSVANLSCALCTFHESISQTERKVAYVHAVVFSPLNIGFPTLILLHVRSTEITTKLLRLNSGNCLALNQALPSAS